MQHKYRRLPTVGWTEKEMLWLKAAITLPAYEFLIACEDISSMSGRTISSITAKAKMMKLNAGMEKAHRAGPRVVEASQLRGLTERELMTGRVRRVRG